MRKRILALLLALVMLMSCAVVLISCSDEDEPPVNNDPNGDNTTPDPEVDLNEGLPGANGASNIGVITDPNAPGAGADSEDSYINEK